jgi:alpha-beta hydrolase superfamily lysophospholipase
MDVRRRDRIQRALGAGALVATLVVTVAAATSWAASAGDDARAGERYEHSLLERSKGRGVLVRVRAGSPGSGIGITVHGINSHCADVAALTLELADRGAATSSFVYDDHYRRLRDSAADLATALRSELAARPGEPLLVRAHSMGSRIVLVALEDLGRDGALDGREVDVALVAPPLGGYTRANFARFTPWPLSRIKNVLPGVDMGRSSTFQRRLESLTLPGHVRVRVFLAEHDRVVDARDPRLRAVAEQLRAETVWLAGATHESAVGAAADWLRVEGAQRRETVVAAPVARSEPAF